MALEPPPERGAEASQVGRLIDWLRDECHQRFLPRPALAASPEVYPGTKRGKSRCMKEQHRRGSLERVVEARIAKNESMFRAANERIIDFAADGGGDDEAIPFLCECADPT